MDAVGRLLQQAKDGYTLFDAILDGMEQEELELLEYELELERDEQQEQQPSVVTLATPSATAGMTLEERLAALRLRQAAASESAAAVLSVGTAVVAPASMTSTTSRAASTAAAGSTRATLPTVTSFQRFSDRGSAAQAHTHSSGTRRELDKVPTSLGSSLAASSFQGACKACNLKFMWWARQASKSSSVSYPSVGKPSWITASETPASAEATTQRRPPPASRQRSIEAIDRLARFVRIGRFSPLWSL